MRKAKKSHDLTGLLHESLLLARQAQGIVHRAFDLQRRYVIEKRKAKEIPGG